MFDMATETPFRSERRESLQQQCVYCLTNARFQPDQILVRGEHFYLSVPAGQLVEGYLVAAPYACVPALSRVPDDWFAELAAIRRLVGDFYRAAYRIEAPLVYEQGRAAGEATCDPEARFPYHAHLCSLPLEIDLHTTLSSTYEARSASGPHELSRVAGDAPYLYVESLDAQGSFRSAVYLEGEPQAGRLERSRLKPEIARMIGAPERGDWRVYPGDAEREQVIRRFAEWMRDKNASTPWQPESRPQSSEL
jgi:diadenosine tetraphosphate (Ap4A) HIT family hydrolase